MSPVRATALQLSLDLQLSLRTLQLSRYARSKRILCRCEQNDCELSSSSLKAALWGPSLGTGVLMAQ